MTAVITQADLAFGSRKAAPFVKGGGRKKSHPNDAKGRTKAKALAAQMRAKGKKIDNSITPKKARKKLKRHVAKVQLRLAQADLAITPGGRVGDASPMGKGKRKLSDYEREVAHALLRKGRAKDKHQAIRMARGIINNWSQGRTGGGKGHVSGAVVAGARASIAQRKSFSNEQTTEIDLAPKWKHGWIPANAEAAALKEGDKVRDRLFQGVENRRDFKKHGTGTVLSVHPKDYMHPRGAVKVKWSDGSVSTHDHQMLEKKIKNSISLANTKLVGDIDLADGAKWHHGYIPANAEAVLEKEHKAKGHGPRSGSKSLQALADPKKYHSADTKLKMTQTALREHAKQHTLAAGRARTADSKAKHLAEAKASMDTIKTKKASRASKVSTAKTTATKMTTTTRRTRKGVRAPAGSESKPAGGDHPKLKVTDPSNRGSWLEQQRAEKEAQDAADNAAHPHVAGAEKGLTHQELLREIKEAQDHGDKRRLGTLRVEVHRRNKEALKATAHAQKAKELIETDWEKAQSDPSKTKRFFAKLVTRAPMFKNHIARLQRSPAALKAIKDKKAFKETIDAWADEWPRFLLNNVGRWVMQAGGAAIGIGILPHMFGGGG